jgi:large subunit ribosomal protein L13
MKKNTYYNPSASELEATWYLIDAKDKRLGKIATRAAQILMGKAEANYVPHLDNGARVIIINAASLDIHPRKVEGKLYWRHSGYPGGIKSRTLGEMMDATPTEVVRKAVRGMLPKNRLGAATLNKLYIYAGDEYGQKAQQPKQVEL